MRENKRIIASAITYFVLFAVLITEIYLSKHIIISQKYFLITATGFAILNYFLFSCYFNKQYKQIKTLLDNVPCALFLKDLEGKIIINNSNSKILDLSLSDNNMKNFYKEPITSIKEDKYVIENKKPLLVKRKIGKDENESSWYKLIKTPVINYKGEVKNIAVAAFNITEDIKKKEKRDTVFSTITHDLKTPTLAQIKALDLLLNNTFGELNENQKEILSQIKESCLYMKDLIFQIMDTCLYSNGKIITQKENFDIIEILNSLLEEINFLYKEKRQKIVVKTTLKNIKIFADKLQIKRAMTNLIANSINYGNIESDIEIILYEENNSFIFKTKNISKYIPEEKIKTIFSKFQKSTLSSDKTGTGLGLYLTKEIIKSHNGEVFAQSSTDGSCIFGFKIPQNVTDKVVETEIFKG